MRLFRVLFVTDLLVAGLVGLIVVAGLVHGLSIRHIDREDLLLWPPLVAGIAAVLGGGWWLRSRGRVAAANAVLLLLAVPTLLGLLALAFLLSEMMRPGAWR